MPANSGFIAIDFETDLISAAAPVPRPICLSTYSPSQGGRLFVGKEAMTKALKQAAQKTIIAHNAKFELQVILEHFPELSDLPWTLLENSAVHCTMIREMQLDNIRAAKEQQNLYSLAALVHRYFNVDISASKGEDAWRTRYAELEHIPAASWPVEARQYAIDDSKWAYEVFFAQISTPGPSPHASFDYTSTRADFVLALIANKGLLVDPERVCLLETELHSHLDPIYDQLLASGYAERDKRGKIKKRMLAFRSHIEQNCSNYRRTDKGQIETTTEALSTYEPQTDVLKAFSEISKHEKILTAFVPALKAAAAQNVPMRTNYVACVSTGRTASRGSKLYPSCNIQQMPRSVKGVTYGVRECFKARPGYKLCSIDYAGLELTSTAHQLYSLLKISSLREALNSGTEPIDLHSKLASVIMGLDVKREITYEEFLTKKKEPEYARYRQLCKAINLGFPGGIGYDVMRTQLYQSGVVLPFELVVDGIESEREAMWHLRWLEERTGANDLRVKRMSKTKWAIVIDPLVRLKRQFFTLYPELKIFLSEMHKLFLNGKKTRVKNDFGEWEEEELYDYTVAGHVRKNCTYTALCNAYLMQAVSAAGAKRMLYKLVKKYHGSRNLNILAFIHDEVLFEVLDDENRHKYIDDVANIMIEGMKEVLNSVRVTVEASLMDYWSKEGGEWQRSYWSGMKNHKTSGTVT